jgi:Ca2+-binding EF-hand superfamily protein
MTNSKRPIIIFTVAALLGTSAITAYAQDASTPAISAEQQVQTPAVKPGFFAGLKAKFGGGEGGFRGGRGGGEMMQKLLVDVDADKSGSVTQDEINAFRAAKVSAADASKDGALSIEEFSTAYNELMRSRMVDAFQNFDEDGDGSITAAELDMRFGSIVANMDRNGDGVLSPADRPQREGKHHGDKRGGNNQNN